MNKELKKFVWKIWYLTKNKKDFLQKYEEGLQDQNLTRRENAQKTLKSILSKYKSLDDFYQKEVVKFKKDVKIFDKMIGNYRNYCMTYGPNIIRIDDRLHQLGYTENKDGSIDDFLKKSFDKKDYEAIKNLILV